MFKREYFYILVLAHLLRSNFINFILCFSKYNSLKFENNYLKKWEKQASGGKSNNNNVDLTYLNPAAKKSFGFQ